MKNKINDWLDLYFKRTDLKEMIELPVLSGSMMPFLVPGRKVWIKSFKGEEIHIGDIIVFKRNNKLNSHRVLYKFKLKKFILFYEKGDANSIGSWIKSKDIVGIVYFSINSDGNKINYKDKKWIFNSKFIAVKQAGKLFLYLFKKTLKKLIGF